MAGGGEEDWVHADGVPVEALEKVTPAEVMLRQRSMADLLRGR
jgi:hypothetical protein